MPNIKRAATSGLTKTGTAIPDVPDAPTVGTATNVGTSRAFNNGAATVAFTANVRGGTPSSYTATSSPGGFTASGASSPLTVTGLQSATSYTFTVSGTNSTATGPNSAASNSITATTVPQAPTIGTATAGNASASVTFTANATGGSAITGYTATSSPGSITGTGSSSPITISGLTNGTPYTFTVTATNANGTSAASAASNSVTPVNPVVSYWSTVGGTIDNFFSDCASNNTANYYVGTSNTVSGIQPVMIFSYNKAGTVNWQQQLSPTSANTPQTRGVALDSNGNIIMSVWNTNSGGSVQNAYLVSMSPSAGEINWQNNYNRGFNVGGVGTPATDSSNSVYLAFRDAQNYDVLFKVNSSGTVQWGRRDIVSSGAPNAGSNHRLAVTGTTSGHLVWTYQYPFGKASVANGHLLRFNQSNGEGNTGLRLGGGGDQQVFEPNGIVIDSSNNIFVSGFRRTTSTLACIVKVNSSLTSITAIANININLNTKIAVNAAGSIFAVGSDGSNGLQIFRFDNNLNLTWQRRLTVNTGSINSGTNTPGCAIDEANNRLVISGLGNTVGYAFSLPIDGSGTGTYSVGSQTFTYNTPSWTVTTTSLPSSTLSFGYTNQTINTSAQSFSRSTTSRPVNTTTF